MEKISMADMGGVSETLLIPLAVRAKEADRAMPLFVDRKSAGILGAIGVGDIVLDGGAVSTHGILVRTMVIDGAVAELLAKHPGSVIINLGAGLDTRMSRLDNGALRWYDLDLEPVIKLRKQFFEESGRVTFIAKSVLDFTWMDEIEVPADANVIIIAEGLLMYFPEQDVRLILEKLAIRFPAAHLLFDVVHTFFVGKGINSPFLWGIDSSSDIIPLAEGARLVRSWSTGGMLKGRQPVMLRIMNMLKSTRNRSQVLHLVLAE